MGTAMARDGGGGGCCRSAVPAAYIAPYTRGTWVIENKHSTDVESSPRPPRVCMRFHNQDKLCSDMGRVLVCNDPPARAWYEYAPGALGNNPNVRLSQLQFSPVLPKRYRESSLPVGVFRFVAQNDGDTPAEVGTSKE